MGKLRIVDGELVARWNPRIGIPYRRILEARLGRSLCHWEKVHHMDGNHGHNWSTNLLAVSAKEHVWIHERSALLPGDVLERNNVPLLMYA